MAWRFLKSFKILPGVRLNVGKKGISSVSVGRGGLLSTNIGKKGVRHSISAPGTGLSYQTKRVGSTGVVLPSGSDQSASWQCPNCQNQNVLNARHCGNCGTFVEQPEWTFAQSPTNEAFLSTRAYTIIGVIVGVLILIVGIGFAIFSAAQKSRNNIVPVNPTSNTSTSTPLPAPTVKVGNKNNKKASNNTRSVIAPLVSRPETETPSSDNRRSGSSQYVLGPRGGCYYLNSSGKKTYVDHSFCK